MNMPAVCRDCATHFAAPGACPACGRRNIVRHAQLFTLAIAHVDCDAFYASVEKRDRPDLASRPVIVGGGERGVVTAACYIARLHGVASAMPMWRALKLCPDATVIRPDFAKYSAVSRAVRLLMQALTPLVQPLSIDEAVLDLSGTEALHGAPPAGVLARFARQVEREIGVTVSIGLAANRMRAKIAAGRDKPRGFCVLGNEAPALLAADSVGILPGVGPARQRRLASAGILRLADLQSLTDREAKSRLGDDGPSLAKRARLEDSSPVNPQRGTRSISAETTFSANLTQTEDLERELWRLSERLAERLREQRFAAAGVVLKLKTAAFASRTRAVCLPGPTALPDRLFAAASALLAREVDGTAYRLIGIGANPLAAGETADLPDLADPEIPRRVAVQGAMDRLRSRFGTAAIGRGRGFKPGSPP